MPNWCKILTNVQMLFLKVKVSFNSKISQEKTLKFDKLLPHAIYPFFLTSIFDRVKRVNRDILLFRYWWLKAVNVLQNFFHEVRLIYRFDLYLSTQKNCKRFYGNYSVTVSRRDLANILEKITDLHNINWNISSEKIDIILPDTHIIYSLWLLYYIFLYKYTFQMHFKWALNVTLAYCFRRNLEKI